MTAPTLVAGPQRPAPSLHRRRSVRYFAAAMAAIASVIYLLIGLRVVTVLDKPEDQVGFGLAAGIAFAIGALMILVVDNRGLWAAGAIAQALIIFMYFSLAAERTPQFEAWGIFIRVAQFLLLGALGYLAISHRAEGRHRAGPPARVTAP